MYKIADRGSSRFHSKVRFKLNKIAKGCLPSFPMSHRENAKVLMGNQQKREKKGTDTHLCEFLQQKRS